MKHTKSDELVFLEQILLIFYEIIAKSCFQKVLFISLEVVAVTYKEHKGNIVLLLKKNQHVFFVKSIQFFCLNGYTASLMDFFYSTFGVIFFDLRSNWI